jgi:hypothetical protein
LSKICARVVRSERPRKTVTYEGVTAVSEFAVNYLFVRDLAAAAGRAAFPDWQPVDEKGDEAQLLPPLRNGETAQLHDPKIEDKETRPPPRYNEGTLIEAMQNAWRFVDDEVLRERLKEAKGIGTPATRAEIIGGLKKQGFLIAQGKHIVPTEAVAVQRSQTGRPGPGRRRDQLRLNRRRQRRALGNAKQTSLRLHWLPHSQIRLQVRRCGFLMATRRPL